YSIQVNIGGTLVPVILDTGSSDLWSVTDTCTTESCGSSISRVSKISASSLRDTGIAIELDYGDSAHPTSAIGTIGTTTVSVAGLSLDNQSVAAVVKTDTGLSSQGISGIFGIGFPNPLAGSIVYGGVFHTPLNDNSHTLAVSLGGSSSSIQPTTAITDAFISTLSTQGPFMSRLAANGQLSQPLFTVTLQREVVEIGGNLGQLTLGALPAGVNQNDITWVPVRLYSQEDGGLAGSSTNSSEVVRWEVPLDKVTLNGQTLAAPSLNVSYTALIDSGTSFLAGPTTVVNTIYQAISQGVGTSSDAPQISCTTPVHLSFFIGGKEFPVDPRDFLGFQTSTEDCTAGLLLSTDDPAPTALMSWILGDPFMKSTLVVFYYGNLTHPSVDPPRMGFLSTVPSDADALLAAAVAEASENGFIGTPFFVSYVYRIN
ncbi:acid protease, partial [Hysterangium stoloniferum]